MPASMMRADTGGSTNVAGKSIAIVAIGPIPGSTPISVPRMQPMKQYQMLPPCRATPKPRIRLFSSSIRASSAATHRNRGLQRLDVGAEGNGQLQAPHEDQRAENRQAHGEDQHRLQLEIVAAQACHDDHHDPVKQHADRLDPKPEDHDRARHPTHRPPAELALFSGNSLLTPHPTTHYHHSLLSANTTH